MLRAFVLLGLACSAFAQEAESPVQLLIEQEAALAVDAAEQRERDGMYDSHVQDVIAHLQQKHLHNEEARLDAEEEEQEEEAPVLSAAERRLDSLNSVLLQLKSGVNAPEWGEKPIWWNSPPEEVHNVDQQPWPLDPNFPMSVLDPPPNLPLANIEDPNNYPGVADPNMAYNRDMTAFPQVNPLPPTPAVDTAFAFTELASEVNEEEEEEQEEEEEAEEEQEEEEEVEEEEEETAEDAIADEAAEQEEEENEILAELEGEEEESDE